MDRFHPPSNVESPLCHAPVGDLNQAPQTKWCEYASLDPSNSSDAEDKIAGSHNTLKFTDLDGPTIGLYCETGDLRHRTHSRHEGPTKYLRKRSMTPGTC